MRARTEPKNRMFPSTQHALAAQVAALQAVRARIQPGMSAQDCIRVLSQAEAELKARLSVNAAAHLALVPPYLGEGMPQQQVAP